jgi:ABC-type nitrate/sulfonate/bicarbonate transport system ATPase subunit
MANRCVVFSARPGRVKTELSVDLPYPRHYRQKTTPRFSELKAQVTEDIRAESLKTAQMADRPAH